ncbi:MAG: CAP domain-containing protein [Actinomycetota bacterium]
MSKRAFTVALVALVGVLMVPVASHADSLANESFRRVNEERTSRGLRALIWNDSVAGVARQHSDDMAARQDLYHNENLTTQCKNWSALGENVGSGQSVDQIHDMFMQSTEHRDNILDRAFTEVGIGVTTDSQGSVWVTQDFYTPEQSSQPATTRRTTSTKRTATHHVSFARRASSPAPSAAPSHAIPTPVPTMPLEPVVEPTPTDMRGPFHTFGYYMPFSR